MFIVTEYAALRKFHDFSMIIQFFTNSIIFRCMELFFVIFKVFHDFQSSWEPCGVYMKTAIYRKNSLVLFGLRFYVTVNSYCHNKTVSSPNHTFFAGKLD